MPTANYQQQFSSYLNSGPINKINKRDSKILPQLHTTPLPFFGGSSPREFQTQKYPIYSLSSSLQLIAASCVNDANCFHHQKSGKDILRTQCTWSRKQSLAFFIFFLFHTKKKSFALAGISQLKAPYLHEQSSEGIILKPWELCIFEVSSK